MIQAASSYILDQKTRERELMFVILEIAILAYSKSVRQDLDQLSCSCHDLNSCCCASSKCYLINTKSYLISPDQDTIGKKLHELLMQGFFSKF